MITTVTVRFGAMMIIATRAPLMTVPPQARSRRPQARMFESRSQSEVMRAMSQPTGRRSK